MTAFTSQVPARWRQLWLGVGCVVLIANLQYGRTLFVALIHQAYGWKLTDIQIAFRRSVFMACAGANLLVVFPALFVLRPVRLARTRLAEAAA